MMLIFILDVLSVSIVAANGLGNGSTSYQCSDLEVTCTTRTPLISCRGQYKIRVIEVRVKDVTSCQTCKTSWWQTSCTCIYYTDLHYHSIAEEALEDSCEGLHTCKISTKNKALRATYKCTDEDGTEDDEMDAEDYDVDTGRINTPSMMKIYVDGVDKSKESVVGYVVMLFVGVILVVVCIVSLICRIYMQRKRDRRVTSTSYEYPRGATVSMIFDPEHDVVFSTNLPPDLAVTDVTDTVTDVMSLDPVYENPPSYESCMYDVLNRQGEEYSSSQELSPVGEGSDDDSSERGDRDLAQFDQLQVN